MTVEKTELSKEDRLVYIMSAILKLGGQDVTTTNTTDVNGQKRLNFNFYLSDYLHPEYREPHTKKVYVQRDITEYPSESVEIQAVVDMLLDAKAIGIDKVKLNKTVCPNSGAPGILVNIPFVPHS